MRGDRRWYRFAGAPGWLPWVWVAASLAVPDAILGQTRVGSEFRVNSYTTDSQREPSVAFTALGDFVVVWTGNYQDGQGNGVFGQRFSSAGAALGGEFQVNEFTVGRQQRPSVASDADGDFVVAWESSNQDGQYYGIFARRFSSAGAALGNELQVNTFTPSAQTSPSLAAEPDGDFVVVWRSDHQDDNDYSGVFGQRFSSAGARIGSEFQVNTVTARGQFLPAVAMAADGRFVVAWDSYLEGLSEYDVVAQRFSSEGAPLGGEFQVNTYTGAGKDNPAVAMHANGGFVVAWESTGQDGAFRGIFVRRFSSAGDAVEGELQINTYTDGGEAAPALAVAPDGGFIVVWAAYADAGGDGTFARRFTSEGSPLASEFRVSTYTGVPSSPAIAIDGAGNFVVAWASYGQENEVDEAGVFAQRFAPAASGVELDIDGDGQTEALTDGLLVLRRFFGFTGTTLTGGAVDTVNCTRCDAAAIEPYIAGLGLALDIDGDTQIEALTDGLLVLRYLFGFTGATLTGGAVDTVNCTRCDATSIEAHLLGLVS